MAYLLSMLEHGRAQAEINLRAAGLESFDIVLVRTKSLFGNSAWRVWAVASQPDAQGARRPFLRGPKGGTMDAAMLEFLDATTQVLADAQGAQFALFDTKQVGQPIGSDGAIVDRAAFRSMSEFAMPGSSSGGARQVEEDDRPPRYEHGSGKMPMREK